MDKVEKAFNVLEHWEKDGVYYIKTEYGELNTKSKTAYNRVVKDGFIILLLDEDEIAAKGYD